LEGSVRERTLEDTATQLTSTEHIRSLLLSWKALLLLHELLLGLCG
jgi:hypothetical protein